MDIGLPNIAIDAAIAIAVLAVIAVVALLVLTRPRARVRRALTLAEVQEGLHRTGIVATEGSQGRIGLDVYVRNRSDAPVDIQIERGTVLEATDPAWQNMVAARSQALDLPPKTIQPFQLDALSLEARKRPPGPRGESGYRIGVVSEDGDLFQLFDAVDSLEKEVARHVRQADGDSIQYRPMSDDLIILAASCRYRRQEQGGYEARITSEVVQYALWQVTDGLELEELADLVLQPYTPQDKARLVRQVLAANVVLKTAGLKSTVGI